jgi:DNA-directed RNA polymerase specialized sigma24 family protein
MGRYWYAVPVKELAREWDMTPNAVSLRLMRTRERLRAYLEEGGYTV